MIKIILLLILAGVSLLALIARFTAITLREIRDNVATMTDHLANANVYLDEIGKRNAAMSARLRDISAVINGRQWLASESQEQFTEYITK